MAGRLRDQRIQSIAIKTAQSQFGSVRKAQQRIARAGRCYFADAVFRDNQPAVNAREFGRIELRLEPRKTFAQQVNCRPDMQCKIVALRLDPIDVAELDDRDTTALLDGDIREIGRSRNHGRRDQLEALDFAYEARGVCDCEKAGDAEQDGSPVGYELFAQSDQKRTVL